MLVNMAAHGIEMLVWQQQFAVTMGQSYVTCVLLRVAIEASQTQQRRQRTAAASNSAAARSDAYQAAIAASLSDLAGQAAQQRQGMVTSDHRSNRSARQEGNRNEALRHNNTQSSAANSARSARQDGSRLANADDLEGVLDMDGGPEVAD